MNYVLILQFLVINRFNIIMDILTNKCKIKDNKPRLYAMIANLHNEDSLSFAQHIIEENLCR
jgi:hypothetical protein